ncbi:MAG TPA: SDR family oxidoreductase [Burkholderiaceae bacterium]|nr:SDR family oxidoreductase [Burkholderiaceae bacterium]
MTPATPSSRPTVLVTGAARRIGRAIAHELARAGFDLALHYRASGEAAHALAEEMRGAFGVRAECFGADLADEAACRALVPSVVARLHRLDVVVNNAAHFAYDNAEAFSYAAMDAHWRANTAPPIVLAQALAAHLKGCAEVGCVVNLSDQKLWNPNPDYLSYTLSKAALESATTLLAMALAPQVRVVGVAPGVTLVSGPAMDEANFEAAHRMTPLGRSSTPEDVARTVRFAIESRAITGTTILVDGGQHLSAQARDVAFLKTT